MSEVCESNGYTPFENAVQEAIKDLVTPDLAKPISTRVGGLYRSHLATLREDGGGEKPAVFYCENGKNLAGLEQGALAVLSNLMMKTNATNAEFMIGNEKDGEFYFTCSRTKPTPAPIGAEVGEALADVELCMRDYAYDPLLGRKLRKHLTTIRAALKNGGSE